MMIREEGEEKEEQGLARQLLAPSPLLFGAAPLGCHMLGTMVGGMVVAVVAAVVAAVPEEIVVSVVVNTVVVVVGETVATPELAACNIL